MVNDQAPQDRDLAMVFQNYALYPHLTVCENIAFPLKLAEASDKSEIDEKVERGGEDRSSSTSTSTASRPTSPAASASGWRWAARSCATRRRSCSTSRCPTSTPSCAVQMRTEIARLQQRLGITTVYVTHDQTEAMTLGDRVAVLRAGRPAAGRRRRAELYDNPGNLFVAGFIGSPPMNFMPATLEGDKLKLPFGEVDARRPRRPGDGQRRPA